MKMNKIAPIFLITALLVGCSSDDTNDSLPVEEHNYFPLTTGNSWSYNNNRQAEGQPATTGSETMTVADSTETNGTVYYDLNSDNSSNIGFATSTFSKGELSKVNGKLVYSGELELVFIGTGAEPLTIPINNAVVFNGSAAAGTELYNFSDSMEQEITVQGQTIPITINYTLSTHNVEVLETYTVGGVEFEDVLAADMLLTASAEASLGPVSATFMDEQEIASAVNYYAEGVGMIYSDVSFDAEFEDLTQFGFPEIPPIHIVSSQEITTWTVVEE
ncbi:MAG TPA: hypothetical protein VFM65_04875 [Flavobacteriaceae bacterium]|nr:hypothetical protein [Flavobacteriaceae bacterium]